MRKQKKTYTRPKNPFNKERILEEEEIRKEFGLKNKKEIWKAEAMVKSIKDKAKKLISASKEEQEAFFDRLRKSGFNVNSIADVLSLDKKDYLKRRLQTVVVSKKLATTPKSARQLIVHKKVIVNEGIINSPSYLVPVELEGKISLKPGSKKPEVKKPEVKEVESKEVAQEIEAVNTANGGPK